MGDITDSCDPNGEDCGDDHHSDWSKGLNDSAWIGWGNGELLGCSAIEQYLVSIYDNIEGEVTDNNNGIYDDDGECSWSGYDPFTWSGNMHVELEKYFGSGDFEVSFYYDYNGCWLEHEYEPCLDWSANSFGAWKNGWDVTIGGLFPLMQSGPFFSDYLDIDQDDWDEDINDSECLDF